MSLLRPCYLLGHPDPSSLLTPWERAAVAILQGSHLKGPGGGGAGTDEPRQAGHHAGPRPPGCGASRPAPNTQAMRVPKCLMPHAVPTPAQGCSRDSATQAPSQPPVLLTEGTPTGSGDSLECRVISAHKYVIRH